nr:unnamed protein product [Digitaria exilis]
MFAKLSDTLSKLICGISPPTTAAEDRYRAGLRSLLLLPPSPERSSSSSSPSASVRSKAAPPEHDDGGGDEIATSPPAMSLADSPRTEEAVASTLPCVAFASEHGYKIFSLAGADAGEVVTTPMAPVVGRRLIPSPYGGNVLATDVSYNHPCHVINPFTGERAAALPDLPIPFSEKEPIRFHPDDHPPFSSRVATNDGLAWDWSPHGVMVARGDTAFFFDSGGDAGSGEWTPVHQSAFGSPMTVNYRGGSFFLLELRSLVTTVIDACTLRVRAEIPAPAGVLHRHVDAAFLAPSSSAAGDEAILLVHRAGDVHGVVFTEAYRWRDKGGRSSPRWSRTRDIGDQAVFVDGAHAFTVDAGGTTTGVAANRVYVVLTNAVARPCGSLAVVYDVGVADVARPERFRRLGIDVGEVEPMWGKPHWIIRTEGSDRRRG